MHSNRGKFVRFEDYASDDSSNYSQNRFSNKHGSIARTVTRGFKKVSGTVKGVGASFGTYMREENQPTKESSTGSKILDPQGALLEKWNKIFVFTCVLAVSLDPLFLYIPVVDGERKCLSLDHNLEITACVLRAFTDIFYVLHIVFQFRTGFIAPSSRVFGRGVLVEDRSAIAKRYLSSYFIVDVLSILPLPQVVILVVIPNTTGPVALVTKEMLKTVVFLQYVPRFFRIFPLYKEVTRTSGIFTETAWAGAAFNLFLYMLASHIVGAFWYLFAIEREDQCWRIACQNHKCREESLYCGDKSGDNSFLNGACPLLEPNEIKNSTDFDFGIFLDALKSNTVHTRNFPDKIVYCFWWGLRNLSSLGQNLKTSTFVGEILFALSISVLGLVLFSLLIGNMQKYLESITVRIEEMRVKRRDAEQWMSHRMLPENLRERVRRHDQYKWQETRGVEEDSLVQNLPKDIRRDIKRHLCWSLLTRVPMFEKMDEQLLDAMCDRLKPVLYTERSFLVREGDPVDEMVFVMRGHLSTITTDGGRTGFFNSGYLTAGDFCGEELLPWALDPNSSPILPTSTRTVEAIKDVEAFALAANDLKFVATQFRRLNSKQIQHTFKLYSQQWRTWGATFIQAAWRRHCRRKMEKYLREQEEKLQDALALANDSGSSPSLGSAIYVSKFAAKALRTLRGNHPRTTNLSPRLLPLMPQKPVEPDFTSEDPL